MCSTARLRSVCAHSHGIRDRPMQSPCRSPCMEYPMDRGRLRRSLYCLVSCNFLGGVLVVEELQHKAIAFHIARPTKLLFALFSAVGARLKCPCELGFWCPAVCALHLKRLRLFASRQNRSAGSSIGVSDGRDTSMPRTQIIIGFALDWALLNHLDLIHL